MPTLVNEHDPDRVLQWTCNTLVGRRMVGGLNVVGDSDADREVSSVHAALFWHRRRRRWMVRDLGSSNGTTVDQIRLKPEDSLALDVGSRVGFGASVWTLREVEPPPAAATCAQGELRVASDDVLLLPDENSPEIVVVSEDGEWHARPWSDTTADRGRRLRHGDHVLAGGRRWSITLPGPGDTRTARGLGRLRDWRLELLVPSTMENIRPTFVREQNRISMAPKRHHEVWWLLAKKRIADRAAGEPAERQGWLSPDELAGQLGAGGDTNYLNVLVHRSRREIARAGFTDAFEIFERGKAPVLLRLGLADVRLVSPTDA